MAKTAVRASPEFRAEAKFQRTSPQKAKLVLDLIKGKRVEAAINIVALHQQALAPVVEKVLRSAVAERGLPVRREGSRRRCRQPVRQHGDRQRRSAHEAHPPCPDGPRVPLPAPHRTHHRHGGGEEGATAETRRRAGARRGEAQGRGRPPRRRRRRRSAAQEGSGKVEFGVKRTTEDSVD